MKRSIKLHYTESTIVALIHNQQSFVHNLLTIIANNNQKVSKFGFITKDRETLVSIASQYSYRKVMSEGQNVLVKKILVRYAEKLAEQFNQIQGV